MNLLPGDSYLCVIFWQMGIMAPREGTWRGAKIGKIGTSRGAEATSTHGLTSSSDSTVNTFSDSLTMIPYASASD